VGVHSQYSIEQGCIRHQVYSKQKSWTLLSHCIFWWSSKSINCL